MKNTIHLIGLSVLLVAGGALSANQPAGTFASPRKNIYAPVSKGRKAVGQVVPLKSYPLIRKTDSSYLILYVSAAGQSNIGMVALRDRMRNPVASSEVFSNSEGDILSVRGGAVADIFPGYIPYEKGKRYPIVSETESEFGLLFKFASLSVTGMVSKADCDVYIPETPDPVPAVTKKDGK